MQGSWRPGAEHLVCCTRARLQALLLSAVAHSRTDLDRLHIAANVRSPVRCADAPAITDLKGEEAADADEDFLTGETEVCRAQTWRDSWPVSCALPGTCCAHCPASSLEPALHRCWRWRPDQRC